MTIEVYSKPACVQCNATYRALEKRNLDYTATDITEDAEALAFVKGLGYMQAPVVVVKDDNGDIVSQWSGFRPEKVEALANGLLTATA